MQCNQQCWERFAIIWFEILWFKSIWWSFDFDSKSLQKSWFLILISDHLMTNFDLCNEVTSIFVAAETSCWWEAATICPLPCDLDLCLLALKVISESRMMWATSVPILVFPGLSVLDLGPMYATDRRQTYPRQTDRRQTASLLNAPA